MGLSFKPETDDMRGSFNLCDKELLKRGAKINAYDPKATKEAKNYYLKNIDVNYFITNMMPLKILRL